jgi:copper transporter 1
LYEGIKSLKEWLNKYYSWTSSLQTVLYMIQVAISYFLMLVVMTYNSYICGSIVIGAGLGYFCFAFKRTTTIDMNEHCH